MNFTRDEVQTLLLALRDARTYYQQLLIEAPILAKNLTREAANMERLEQRLEKE